MPPGSTAALDDPTAARPVFTPDVAGVYEVSVTAFGAGGASETAVKRLTAATYDGASSCAVCHPARAATTDATAHARTVEDLGAALFAGAPECLQCHVLDPVPFPAAPVPGGYAATAASEGFTPSSFTSHAAFAAAFPGTADRASVQCESCHGPGSGHRGDPRRIAVSLRAELCGACHNGFVGPDRIGEWTASAHGRAPPAAALAQASCRRCHTAHSFLRDQAGLPPETETAGAPGVTCAACHDPHDATNPSNARLFGAAPLASGGAVNAGRAATCFACHQSDVEDAAAHAAANGPFPCAVQSDMLSARGGVEFGGAHGTSFHGTTVFRLRTFTGDPADPDYPDACVTCHSVEGSTAGLGGHTFRMRQGAATLATAACATCHPGLDTYDRRMGRDFDGDGLALGVQTEVSGLLEIVYAALSAADTGRGLSRPGGALTPVAVSPDSARTTPLLRQAAYNYNFVVTDGSLGIHNTTYAVQLLQRTYGQLTGIPFRTAFPRAFTP